MDQLLAAKQQNLLWGLMLSIGNAFGILITANACALNEICYIVDKEKKLGKQP